MVARVALFSEWASTPLRFLFKIISRTKRARIDAISCTPIPQGITPIVSLPIPSDRKLVQDNDYYKSPDATDGHCLIKVEDTLFKVHRFVLARDTSAFEAMFSVPMPTTPKNGTPPSEPVSLTDTVEQFRDLLWALYALPSDLQLADAQCGHANTLKPSGHSPCLPITRLLNIAEMAHKYGFASFESWALSHIVTQVMDPGGPLHTGSSEICAKILEILILTDHPTLCELTIDTIVGRLLDLSNSPELSLPRLLATANFQGISKLKGAVFYRYLLHGEKHRVSDPGALPFRYTPELSDTPIIPPNIYLSAFHTLVNTWEHIRRHPPHLECNERDTHEDCVSSWCRIWTQAAMAAEQTDTSSADILSRLKFMDGVLRRSLWSDTSIPLECALAALESCTNLRDSIINNLSDIFEPM